jgi:hypothetical protein
VVACAFDVTWDHAGFRASFHVGIPTVVLVALAWLPSVIRLVATAGGTLKTPIGEAASPGLGAVFDKLSPAVAQDILVPSAAALNARVPGLPTGPDRAAAESVLRELRTQLTLTAERSDQLLSARFAEWAARYEEIRATMPSGSARTQQMTGLTELARATITVWEDADAWLTECIGHFATAGAGERVITLAALSARPLIAGPMPIAQAIRESKSAFEQKHALVAAQALAPELDRSERAQLTITIETALNDRTRFISGNSDRS